MLRVTQPAHTHHGCGYGTPVIEDDIRAAYIGRADEYTDLLGSIEDMEAPDVSRIAAWADERTGAVLDAGCGPGHWTAFLADRGLDARGVDLVPAFVSGARARFPRCRFEVGDLERLPFEDACFDGVLAWYSLIHREPARMPSALAELRRVMRPGASLLVGFFTGDVLEPFAHAVTPAYRWPVDALVRVVEENGFRVDDTETRRRPGARTHASISAHRAVSSAIE